MYSKQMIELIGDTSVKIPTIRKTPAIFCALLSASLVLCATTLQADDSSLEYTASLYMWAPSMTVQTPTGFERELPFHQILDDLQMTFMGDFSARREKWSFTTDLIYMDLKQGKERNFTGPMGRQFDLKGTIGMKSWIVTPTVGYTVYDNEDAQVEVVGGVRYLWLKVGLKINENGRPVFDEAGSNSFWDGVFGLRASVNLNDSWYVPAYADVGAGNSDNTWQALSGIGYRWKRYQASLVYRYLQYKFDDIPTLSKLQVKGPLLNFSFNF